MCRELCKEMDIAFLKHSDWKCELIQPPFYGGARLDLCLRSTLCWTVVPHTFYPNTEEAESVRSLREFQANQDNMEKPRLGCGEERKRRRRKNCVMGSFRERANVNHWELKSVPRSVYGNIILYRFPLIIGICLF